LKLAKHAHEGETGPSGSESGPAASPFHGLLWSQRSWLLVAPKRIFGGQQPRGCLQATIYKKEVTRKNGPKIEKFLS
jgi:hypothetical protein